MINPRTHLRALLAAVLLFAAAWGEAAEVQGPAKGLDGEQPTLAQAVMCEDVRQGAPHRPAVVFSSRAEQVVCFTRFDPVPEKTWIHHNWYRRDRLSRRIRLELHPPRWDTYSRIQLRENDKGPWRVEISDRKGRVVETLRFSITD